MKNSLFGFEPHSSEGERSVCSGIQVAILVLSALSLIISAARLIYDVFGDKLRRDDYEDYEDYDFDPSDICDSDEEYPF
ncbi:MAG: hypothetical protein SOU50_06325 [Oscillospiraceae bacterium]|nr:hypothetical protein [Oscillospiraceae bacterium]MDY2847818.1 hypothetical protein [Oscillospiraceae bacterium]